MKFQIKKLSSFLLFALFLLQADDLFAQNKSSLQSDYKDTKVGLVLSGGGAKGFAHLELIRALEEANVRIDYIAGTSIGAIIGGLYSSGYSVNELQHILEGLNFDEILFGSNKRVYSPLFKKTHQEKYIFDLPFDDFKIKLPKALSSGHSAQILLTDLLQHVHSIKDFGKLPIPFFCIATNIETGDGEILDFGYLPEALLASAAYPTLINPVKIDSELYVDGGISNNFPVKELKNKYKDIDIIIGVDLGSQGLSKKDKLVDITKVLEQIVSFSIVKKTEEQRPLVDILIQPALNDFSVVDFDKLDTIQKLSRKSIEPFKDKFIDIASNQKKKVDQVMRVNNSDLYVITEVEISGNEHFGNNYIRGKLNIKEPELLSLKKLKRGIDALYATENFSNVSYRFEESTNGFKKIIIVVVENQEKFKAKLGVHYDDVFKTGLLVNFTTKNFLTINSIFSLDVVLGDNFRYYLNYFVDNGVKPSVGFNSSFLSFTTKDSPNRAAAFSSLDYNWRLLTQKAYVQSTLYEKYAAGFGVQYEYVDISTEDRNSLLLNSSLEASYFLSPYVFLRIDNRDHPVFPSKGTKLDATYSSAVFKNSSVSETTNFLKVSLESSVSLPLNFTLRYKGFVGVTFSGGLPTHQNFFVGGVNEQNISNFERFYGLPFGYANEENIVLLQATLQKKIKKNHYLRAMFNVANLEGEFIDMDYYNYNFLGYGFSYGYDSPIGPLQAFYSASPNTSKGLFNVSLGFSF